MATPDQVDRVRQLLPSAFQDLPGTFLHPDTSDVRWPSHQFITLLTDDIILTGDLGVLLRVGAILEHASGRSIQAVRYRQGVLHRTLAAATTGRRLSARSESAVPGLTEHITAWATTHARPDVLELLRHLDHVRPYDHTLGWDVFTGHVDGDVIAAARLIYPAAPDTWPDMVHRMLRYALNHMAGCVLLPHVVLGLACRAAGRTLTGETPYNHAVLLVQVIRAAIHASQVTRADQWNPGEAFALLLASDETRLGNATLVEGIDEYRLVSRDVHTYRHVTRTVPHAVLPVLTDVDGHRDLREADRRQQTIDRKRAVPAVVQQFEAMYHLAQTRVAETRRVYEAWRDQRPSTPPSAGTTYPFHVDVGTERWKFVHHWLTDDEPITEYVGAQSLGLEPARGPWWLPAIRAAYDTDEAAAWEVSHGWASHLALAGANSTFRLPQLHRKRRPSDAPSPPRPVWVDVPGLYAAVLVGAVGVTAGVRFGPRSHELLQIHTEDGGLGPITAPGADGTYGLAVSRKGEKRGPEPFQHVLTEDLADVLTALCALNDEVCGGLAIVRAYELTRVGLPRRRYLLQFRGRAVHERCLNNSVRLLLHDLTFHTTSGERFPLTVHHIRHAFATYWRGRGASMELIQSILGHDTIRQTAYYARHSDQLLLSRHGLNPAGSAVPAGTDVTWGTPHTIRAELRVRRARLSLRGPGPAERAALTARIAELTERLAQLEAPDA